MPTFRAVVAAAEATRPATLELPLAHDERARSRHVTTLPDGTPIVLLLPRGTALTDGTVLAADDGTRAVVRAAAEPVLCVAATTPQALVRVVYHLANRHVPMQLAADHVLIEPDPVLARLAQALGATVESQHRPFEPEPGAYQGHGQPGHGRHGDPVGQGGHAAGQAAAHPHSHGDGGATAELDAAAGRIGEQLSIEAHARPRAPAAP